jgi:PAS domain S-box-containing protein
LDEKTYNIIFARSPTPTLYVVSRKVELANPAAKKLLKRLDVPVAESVAFGKLWPKGTTATGKGGLTGLKALKSGEYEVTLPDGAVLTVDVTALPGKRPARAVVTLEDVTENVNKENVLRESEERYKSLLDTMNDGFGIQDEDGVITYVNDRLCDMLGYSRKDLIGRPATELMDDVNKEILIEQTAKREKERGEYYELVLTSKEGKEIHTMVYPSVIRDVDGNYIGSSAVITDITERKLAEEVLSESHQRFLTVLESLDAGVYVADMETYEILFANRKIRKYFGDVVGETCWKVLQTEQTGPCEFCTNDKLLDADGNPTDFYAWEYKNPISGLVCEIRDRAVRWLDGRTVRLEIAIDISERKRAEEALRESEEKLRAQYKGIPVPTYTWQRVGDDFVLVGYNDAADTITQGNVADFVGTTATEMYRDTPEIIEELSRCFGKKTAIEREMVYEFKVTGESKHLAVKYAFVPPDLVLVHTEDITDRKRGEEELRRHRDHLEELVEERTAQLKKVNVGLEDEITEREQAEEELSKSEREKSAILENMSEYVVYTDKEMSVIWANKTVADWFESAPDDLTGRKCYEMWFGRDRVCDDCHVLTVFETGKRAKCERKLSDGSIWNITCDPVRDDSGEIIGAVEVSSDVTESKQVEEELRKHRDHLEELVHERTTELEAEITERKRSEEALRKSEEEFRLTFENAKDAIFWADPDTGLIIRCNKAAEALLGKSREEIIGHKQTGVHPPHKREYYAKLFKKHIKQKGTVSDEAEVITKSGKIVPVQINASVTLVGGKPIIQGIFQDITERKQADEALRESEEKYRNLIELSNDAVAIVQDGVVKFANERVTDIFGYSVEELIGRDFIDFIHPDEVVKLTDNYERRMSGKAVPSIYETVLKNREGESIYVEINAGIIQYEGKPADFAFVRDIAERKTAEEALRASEEKYRTLIDNAGAPVTYLNPDGTILLINAVGARNLGGTPDDFVGKSIYELLPDMADEVRERIRQVVESEAGYDFEDLVELPSGGRWFYSNHQPVIDASGKVFAVQIVSQDITERKRSEEALRESEEKYRNLVELSNDAVAIIQDGVVRFANERVTDILGYSVEELIGKDFIDYIHPDEEAKLTDIYERRMSGKEVPSIYETVLKNKKGESVHVEINAGIIQYEGKPADFAFVRDITERKAAGEALSLSESKYHDLYDNAPVPYFTVDIEGYIKRANKAAEYFTGYRLEELLEKKVFDLYADESKGKAEQLFNKFKRGESWDNEEIVYLKKDGQKAYGSLSVSPIEDEDGQIIESRSVIIDITERKTVELERNVVADVNQILAESLGTSATVSEVFDILNRLFDFDRMSIAVLSDDGETFRVFEAIEKGKAPPEAYEAGTVLPAAGTALSECVSTRDIFIVDDLKGSKFVETKKLYKAGLRAVVLLPLIIAEKGLGTWNIGSKRKGAFKDVSLETLEELSAYIAMWLEARLTYEKVVSSEEQYRTLQTNVPVGVFRTTAEPGGHLISANPALTGMFGYETLEEIYDLKVSDLYLNPKDRENFIDTISSAGAITDYVVELKRADGTSFWGSLSARAVKGAAGRVAYFDGILEDVTERKEAELALADSEKKYRTLYETTRALSVYADIDEVLRSIGEQASILFEAQDCTIYTINRDEGVLVPRYSDSRDFRDEVMSFNVPIGLGIIGHVAETGEGIIVNYDDKDVGLTIPGTERSDEDAESVAAVPLKTKDEVAGVIILSKMGEKFYAGDLDALYAFSAQAAVAVERAGLLEEVRTSEEKYRTTFESTGTAIVLNEEDTTISFANKGFEILSGCPREEVENKKSWTEFVAPYELERMRGYHDERRRPSGEAPSEYEYDFMRPDGSVRRVFVSMAMVPGTKQSVASLIDITELRRAEERYRTTVESTGTAMALVDENGVVTFVNKEMEKLGGVAREDLENKVRWTDLILPKDVSELRRYESELRQGREIPQQIEFRFVRPHDDTRHFLLNAALLPGTTTLVVSVLDITDRKHAEETVERERRAFAVVAKAAAQGKDIRDMCERVLTGLNDALGFDVGSVRLYNEEEKRLDKTAVVGIIEDDETLAPPPQLDDKLFIGALIARTRKEIFAPDVAAHEVSKTHKKRIDELGIKGLVGYPLIGAGGRLIGTMELIARKVINLGGAENEIIRTVVEMLTVAIERRLADEAVAESEEKYRALFEQAGDAVYLETLDGKILEVNEQACDMLGYTRDELLEMGVADITPPEIREVLPDVANELSEKGAVQMEAVNVKKDGSLVPVEVNARLISVGGRRLVFALVRDISVHKDMVQGLKKQAYELLDLKRAKDTLTDLVVHDIKNISSSMLVWLELLQDGVFGPMSNEQDETIARVIDNNMQLFDLSQELLDVARSEEGEIQLRKHPFLLDKSVTELAEYYLPTAEKQSKNLDLDIKDEPILVYADEERVRRVISNLVTNALKFVEPNEGEVRVSVDKDEKNNSAVVRVADNGRGIPEEFQEMIFEKFRQVELRDAGFKRGAGLGLTFCKMVVSEHDGDMWVESDGERGSTFVFTLPLYQR